MVFGAAAAVSSWLAAYLVAPLPLAPSPPLGGPVYRASGVVDVHTSLSDGSGTPQQVMAAAARAGADFIVIADHDRLDPAGFDVAEVKPGVPVVVPGAEISTEAGDVLAIGIRPPTFRFSGTLSEVLDDIHYLGGCAFASHPTSPDGGTRFTGGEVRGGFGIELVNADTAWREAPPWTRFRAAWTYPAHPAFALGQTLGTLEAERGLWDRLLARRFAPAVGGTGAHGRIALTRASTRSLPLPSYESLFGVVRTVVHLSEPLPKNRTAAASALSRALCAGASVIAIPSFADPSGFAFIAERARGGEVGPGAVLPFARGTRLRVGGSLPEGTRLRLIESGRPVAEGTDSLNFEVVREGVYRAEAYLRGMSTPWVLSNPISILSPATRLSRQHAAEPSVEDHVVGAAAVDRFEGETRFTAEHDRGSAVSAPVIDPSSGRGGGDAMLLSFRLGISPVPPARCALVDRTPPDLSARRGLSFWVKADGDYRIWIRLGHRTSDSADQGLQVWFASVRTSAAWTLHNIPFHSLRSTDAGSDGAFEPGKIGRIEFVVDHRSMAPGSAGRIWIDDLRAF